ncbi:SPOR domain-containing protein [Chthonobacter albigriseus]|uniref:SPOR domain-containing protein n=1 Tax=Chthonobacter albigriseus TaxID=1683161 RepID=UPI0015EF7E37|nr:SPOR domain-containing protein [Chthonobacter albigriseus]
MRFEFGSRARAVARGLAAAILAATMVAATPRISEANPKYAAIVVDTASGKVLYQSSPDARRYPASLTKMMTLYVLFEDLERGRFRLGTALEVSQNAARQAPSKLGLRAGSTISVEDAIKALVTKSANDASVVIAENVSGSVPAFAERMTRTARALGMSNTRFRNPNGLPDGGQYTTARDMMKLGVALQVRFPKYYTFFQTRSFVYRGRTHGNHNNLLGRVEGVDGIKTGYINASGFNLVSSVKRDGRKIVAVVMGGQTARKRDAHMVQLINKYLPMASRAKGYDADLVAEIRSVPPVAASTPHPVPTALANHPKPAERPAILMAGAVPDVDPADVADEEIAEVAEPPIPRGPVTMATATLPSSAAEAFADVAAMEQGDRGDSHDALGAMIEDHIGEAEMEVASIEPVLEPAPLKTAAPKKAPKAEKVAVAAEEAPARSASGWVIQIGAVDSKSAAKALIDKARDKGGKALAGADPLTESFTKGGQTYVRARFAGFDSEKAAQKACAALKRKDFACFTLRL